MFFIVLIWHRMLISLPAPSWVVNGFFLLKKSWILWCCTLLDRGKIFLAKIFFAKILRAEIILQKKLNSLMLRHARTCARYFSPSRFSSPECAAQLHQIWSRRGFNAPACPGAVLMHLQPASWVSWTGAVLGVRKTWTTFWPQQLGYPSNSYLIG